MRLVGQRWEFRIGNSLIKVDNAFTWSLWGQERMLVNDEAVQASSGWSRFSQKYQEPWLTMVGEGKLKVQLRSTAMKISCKARLDGEEIEPTEIYGAVWRGPAHSWPDEAAWNASDPAKSWAQ